MSTWVKRDYIFGGLEKWVLTISRVGEGEIYKYPDSGDYYWKVHVQGPGRTWSEDALFMGDSPTLTQAKAQVEETMDLIYEVD